MLKKQLFFLSNSLIIETYHALFWLHFLQKHRELVKIQTNWFHCNLSKNIASCHHTWQIFIVLFADILLDVSTSLFIVATDQGEIFWRFNNLLFKKIIKFVPLYFCFYDITKGVKNLHTDHTCFEKYSNSITVLIIWIVQILDNSFFTKLNFWHQPSSPPSYPVRQPKVQQQLSLLCT